MTNDWIDLVIQQWKREKIELNPGFKADDLFLAESTLDFIFPNEFKELYIKVNGFQENEWRTNMFSIWSIERIIEEYNFSEDKNFIGFSDYLINSHQIGFLRDKKGIYKYYENSGFISNTFAQSIHLINIDSELIYV